MGDAGQRYLDVVRAMSPSDKLLTAVRTVEASRPASAAPRPSQGDAATSTKLTGKQQPRSRRVSGQMPVLRTRSIGVRPRHKKK